MAQRSERAFAEIVERHIDMIHSTARRLVGDSHAADVTQSVFISLARQAGSIRNPRCLGGWLYRTTRFTAARFLRAESRRRQREQLAYETSMLEVNASNAWRTLAPLIDEAIATLSEKDQDALELRFFESKTLREVGAAMGISDEAAQKRVERAVEKLRVRLVDRGVAASIPLLTATLAANSVQAAPAGLAASVASASCGVTAFTAETLLLTVMSTAKAKTALVGLIALAVVSTSVVLIWQQDAKIIQSVSKQELRPSQPSRTNTAQATTTKSFDEVISELRRLAAVPNYRLRQAGLWALANAVSPADISVVITRAEALLDSRVAAPFTNVLLSRLAESAPHAAITCAQSLSNRERVIEGVQTVLKTWLGRDPKAMIAWAKNLPSQDLWPNSVLRNEAMMAIIIRDLSRLLHARVDEAICSVDREVQHEQQSRV